MEFQRVPFDAPVERYAEQAAQLLDAYRAGDPQALRIVHQAHPRFRDAEVKWLARLDVTEEDVRNASLDLADMQLVVARGYEFLDWPALATYVESLRDPAACAFETAVEAIVQGDLPVLQKLLAAHSELVRARSGRVCCFDPPRHRAALLHYLAANGVEGHRQKSPPNAVEIAKALLQAGAEPDALASMYGEECTTMSMLVSSTPPADAGLQVQLVEKLVEYGASVEPHGTGAWESPLITALAFGFAEAAEALVRHGANVKTLPAAAGLGRLEQTRDLLPGASPEERHRAFAFAAQHGRTDVVRLLLDAGEDPNRYNPDGAHAHSTPLHQAALAGHEDTVRLMVERGARIDIPDTIYDATPLGWAMHGGRTEIENFLRAHGAAD